MPANPHHDTAQPGERWLTRRQVAELTGLHPDTVRKVQAKRFPNAVFDEHRRRPEWLIPLSDVHASGLLAVGTQPPGTGEDPDGRLTHEAPPGHASALQERLGHREQRIADLERQLEDLREAHQHLQRIIDALLPGQSSTGGRATGRP